MYTRTDILELATAMFQRPMYALEWPNPDWNPFVNAAQDYDVLVWARELPVSYYREFLENLAGRIIARVPMTGPLSNIGTEIHFGNYHVGDYAYSTLSFLDVYNNL